MSGKTQWVVTKEPGQFAGEQDLETVDVSFVCEDCGTLATGVYSGPGAIETLEDYALRSGWAGSGDQWYCPAHRNNAAEETTSSPTIPQQTTPVPSAEVIWPEGSDRDHAERVYFDPSVLTDEEKSGIMLATDILRFGEEEDSGPYVAAIATLSSIVLGDR